MNVFDLYSENIYTPVEEKQNERRFIIACIAALLIHIGLFIAVGMSSLLNHKRPEEIKIVNVQIHREDVVSSALPAAGRQSRQKTNSPIKKQTKPKAAEKPAAEKQIEKQPKKQTEKPITETAKQPTAADHQAVPTKSPKQTAATETPTAENTEPQAVTEQPTAAAQEQPKPIAPPQPDIFEQMTKAADQRAAAQKQQWTDAHAKQETTETAEDIAAKEAIGNVTAAKNSPDTSNKSGGSNTGNAADTPQTTDSNNISWSSGTSRRLISSGDIIPPDEIAVMGIKTLITIRFEVFDNGLIGKVEIINSTGDSEWDNDIAGQFKSKYKFAQADGKASGIITISIGY